MALTRLLAMHELCQHAPKLVNILLNFYINLIFLKLHLLYLILFLILRSLQI